ncbi:MAG: hypothetical protein IJ928_06835 [Prevotella sp.]|nr:hypothetical protein [Prevotella sp.]
MKTFTKVMACLLAALLTACESRHEQLQKQIEERHAALKHHQDSSLLAAQLNVEKLDTQLQQARWEYARLKRNTDAAYAQGTATASQLRQATLARLRRDSLQAAFDAECAKIRYIKKRQEEENKQ